MRIAIVDDERHWIDDVDKLVRRHYIKDNVEIDIYESGVKYIESKKCYDVSFIDIEMPELDGFNTIIKAREQNKEGIFIILTTHVEMSRKGYHVNAFRYIDKTRLDDELDEALDSAELVLSRNEKVSVNVIDYGIRELALKNIIYIESGKHCILIHTNYGNIRCSSSLSEMESILIDKWFYRCHNAFIVNLDEIKSMDSKIAYMSNGEDIDISRRRLRNFKRAYLARQFECANA